ncbi:FAS1-like dehydratase domain-containing protein [Palleronia sp. KMU-117]|uniref:FAS1-like dehydratase domain-containing protein n=1 Tax=Palleronia sp. KMU-117 TaxID=3434108 RepID=UPI003D71013F
MIERNAFPEDEADPQVWVGRVETREGALTPEFAGMLGATLSHPLAAARDLTPGAPMPPLWHWVAFPEFVPMAGLGADGHPALGGFLPPLPYARRMWAGGKLTWEGRLTVGEVLHRRSELLAITEKEGATGPMVFVRVGHDIEGAEGRISEEQDIVYLDIPDRFRPPKAIPAPRAADFDETVPMTEARLFRYSAATFNAHRIHYDLPYAREIERYPALVVHGPMQATLLIEAACRHFGATPRRFRFKGVHPMFHDQDLRLIGTRVPGEGAAELCTAAASGHQGMQARLEWDA